MKKLFRLSGGILGVLGILAVGPSSPMPGRTVEKGTGMTKGLSAQQFCEASGGCVPRCHTSTHCDPSTFAGAFIQQKPNDVCVYECVATRQCTTTTVCDDGTITVDNFSPENHYRVRPGGFPTGGCPGAAFPDEDTINAFCQLGEPPW